MRFGTLMFVSLTPQPHHSTQSVVSHYTGLINIGPTSHPSGEGQPRPCLGLIQQNSHSWIHLALASLPLYILAWVWVGQLPCSQVRTALAR